MYVFHIFSSSCVLSFYFNYSFWRTEILVLMKSNLPFFSFMGCAFYIISKESLPNPSSQRFFPVFFHWIFLFFHTVLGFTFRPLTHLDFIVQGKAWDSFYLNFFLHIDVQFFHDHLLKRLFFLCWITLAPLLKINLPYICGPICGLNVMFHLFMSVLTPVLHYL